MIIAHWELEKQLLKNILESTPENRWEVFESSYSTLYREMEWLNRFEDKAIKLPPAKRFRDWLALIDQFPKGARIYEIGSGRGELISFLAECGFICTATEITRQRSKTWNFDNPNLSWNITDGIHLDRFENPCSYEIVISNQVIEHFHPDDLMEHFKGVLAILSPNGKYIFATPHSALSLGGLYWALKLEETGLHLKEYTYAELKHSLTEAGFKNISAVFRLPASTPALATISKLLGPFAKTRASRLYTIYLSLIEKLFLILPRKLLKSKRTRLPYLLLFYTDIFIVAEKI